MNPIHPCFKSKKILTHMRNLIEDYGYKSFSNLSHADKCEIAGLLCEASGDAESLIESSSEIMSVITKSFLNHKSDAVDDMFDIKTHIVDYYSNTIKSLFDSVYSDFCNEEGLVDNFTIVTGHTESRRSINY